MNSRSRASRSSVVVVVALMALAVMTASAYASRKRVVVLPFEGDKAEKFHDSVVKLIKKTHTVLSSAKWGSTAENLSADSMSDKDIKKVAKKLKIDGVIEGKIEKRRNEYILRFKLHAGTSGAMVKTVNTKAENIKLDGDAAIDIKDELVSAIGELETNRTSNDDEDEEPAEDTPPPKKGKDKKAAVVEDDEEVKPAPKKKDGKDKKAAVVEDDEEVKPASKKKDGKDKKAAVVEDDEEIKPAKDDKKKKSGGFSKKSGGMDDESEALKTKKDDSGLDENPLPEEPKKTKKVAKKDDGEGEGEEGVSETAEVTAKTGAAARAPGERAIDAVVGLSLTTRRLTWATDGDLVQKPPAYKGLPAPGGMFDLTFFPMAFGHKNEGITKDIGVTASYEQALLISSKDQNGNKLETAYSRYAFGGVFRKALGSSVIGGSLTYGRQSFQIQNSEAIGIPNVNYTILEPAGFFRYPMNPKITLNVDLGFMAVLKTGQMQKTENYGGASVLGFEGEVGGDYALTGSLFVRAGLKVETIGYKFNGNGMRTNADADPEQDVQGARDTYIGLVGTLGYIY
jgi:hypothetical protein